MNIGIRTQRGAFYEYKDVELDLNEAGNLFVVTKDGRQTAWFPVVNVEVVYTID